MESQSHWKIYREDDNGKAAVESYADIGPNSIASFLKKTANKEAEERTDVRKVIETTSFRQGRVVPRYLLMGRQGEIIAEYTMDQGTEPPVPAIA